jgi:hypothetical protein
MTEPTNVTESENRLRALGAEADAETNTPARPAPEVTPPTPSAAKLDAPSPAHPENPKPATDDYARAAQEFERQGEAGLAELAGQQALAAQHLAARAEREAFHRHWWDTVRREVEATPELKDERSEIGQTLQTVLRETPLYSLAPDGFRHAAAFAKARQAAATLPALQARLEALAKENDRLVKLTSVTGSGPAKLSGESDRDFNERDLRRMASEIDSL